jgi:D-lactate dehydrogenase (cytochrome)
VRGAVETVIDALQMGVTPARCELLDAVCIDAVNRYSGLSQTVAPSLFLEFHGDARGVEAQAAAVAEIAADRGGGEFRWSSGQEERERLWQARHDAAYALMALRPGGRAMSTDVCVPISRLAECIEATRAEVESTPFPASILGHVGDGNYHVVFIVDPERRDEIEAIESAHARMIERALSMDGTCTGEHGVGCGKVAFMRAEHGEGVEVMRAIKSSLDPLGLMNPGKVLPAPEGPERPFDTPPLGSRR